MTNKKPHFINDLADEGPRPGETFDGFIKRIEDYDAELEQKHKQPDD